MIFVTVGTQLPFDRLIAAIDDWAGETGREDVFAQTGGGAYQPVHMEAKAKITPAECRRYFEEAEVVVAHAGMGTIISAIEAGKPLVIMPRLMEYEEHRNDHQVATCERFQDWPHVYIAHNEGEIREKIEAALVSSSFDGIDISASPQLLGILDGFFADTQSKMDVDGIICFGGVDWWYHNRGHYDIQMMRELSKRVPVLYVNSIGMRTPNLGEGKVFFKRVSRKLQSWRRGLSLVRKNFGVLSPLSIPVFQQTEWGKRILADQVQDAALRMGIKNPLLWIACPPAAEVIDKIASRGIAYQRTDRMEHFPGVNTEQIRNYDRELKKRADLTLFCSTSVFEDESSECSSASFVDHGVDYTSFVSADDSDEPDDVRAIARPRVGFVGGIDAHTFDPDLFVQVATGMTDCSFVLVGGCSLPEGWCELDNVHFLGRKQYEDVASYMAACDVLIMPWNQSPWIKACNPVKLKEYLAVGRPVVSTPFDELSRYADYVTVAEDADDFIRGIRTGLESTPNVARLRERVKDETWAAKADAAVTQLKATGVKFRESDASGAETLELEDISSVGQVNTVKETNSIPHMESPGYWKKSILAIAGFVAAIGLWVTLDAWKDIFLLGTRDEESSHVLLAVPAALWLAWIRREYAAEARRTGMWLGPLMVAVGWFLFALGDVQLYQSVWHFGAILIVAGCIVSVFGREVFIRAWPAFAVLIFLIPVPAIVRAQIAPPMQTITAQMTAFLLQTMGEQVTLSGKVLIVNDVSVGIAEACNGIRMVFALALVCFFYAFSAALSTRNRLFIVLASPIVAITVNVVRLVPTVWLYGHTEMATAEAFHDFMGWAMMPIALAGLMGLHTIVSWALKEDPEAEFESVPPGNLATVQHSKT